MTMKLQIRPMNLHQKTTFVIVINIILGTNRLMKTCLKSWEKNKMSTLKTEQFWISNKTLKTISLIRKWKTKLLEYHCISKWVSKWVKAAQSCPTLCDPIDYTVHGILQARILQWVVAFPFSRGSSQPRARTQVFCIAGIFLSDWCK